MFFSAINPAPWPVRPPYAPGMLRMSRLLVRTLREDPADAEVPSHRLLTRAGYIRRVAPGGYLWLPLGKLVLDQVARVIREELAALGAQEVSFPALRPREPYERSGRWDEYGDDIFRLTDRRGLRCTPVAAMSGPMGGSVSEEFLAETPVGEDTFVGCAACGYAANVEAVTTPAPPVADLEHPPLQVLDTPDTPTIDALVALLNTMGAGGRTGWRAGEMLKNVVLTVDGELLVIGVPGDRDV